MTKPKPKELHKKKGRPRIHPISTEPKKKKVRGQINWGSESENELINMLNVAAENTFEEPGNQEPGNQEPGNQEPGNQEPGNQEPGNQEPGNQEPGNQEPGNQEPGNQEPGTETPEQAFKRKLNEFQQKAATDQEVTDQPGTDQPGTDQPGTDQPGTDNIVHKSLLPLAQQLIYLDKIICLAVKLFMKKEIKPMPPDEAEFLEALAGGEVFNIIPTGKNVFYVGLGLYYYGKLNEIKKAEKKK